MEKPKSSIWLYRIMFIGLAVLMIAIFVFLFFLQLVDVTALVVLIMLSIPFAGDTYKLFLYLTIYRRGIPVMGTIIAYRYGIPDFFSRTGNFKRPIVQFDYPYQEMMFLVWGAYNSPLGEIGSRLEVKYLGACPDRVIMADKEYLKNFTLRYLTWKTIPIACILLYVLIFNLAMLVAK